MTTVPTTRGVPFTGFTNPALAAIEVVEYLFPRNQVNRHSFEEIARVVGDSPESVLRDGFFVNDFGSLERLCRIGGFSIDVTDGEVRCVLRSPIPGGQA